MFFIFVNYRVNKMNMDYLVCLIVCLFVCLFVCMIFSFFSLFALNWELVINNFSQLLLR